MASSQIPPPPPEQTSALVSRLRHRLNDPALLGLRKQGQRRFSPQLAYGRHFGPAFSDSKPAAVMVLLEPRQDGWYIPLTVRPRNLPDHPGQICLPGGRLESQEGPWEAAQREFTEELGIPYSATLVGELSPIFVFNSNYAVRPYVAVSHRALIYRPNRFEVERMIHLPATSLFDRSCQPQASFQRGSLCWQARVIEHGEDQVWGATAIMLGELSVLLEGLFDEDT